MAVCIWPMKFIVDYFIGKLYCKKKFKGISLYKITMSQKC